MLLQHKLGLKRRCQKLAVVQLVIAALVHCLEYPLRLSLRDGQSVHEDVLQLVERDGPVAVLVELLENLFEVIDFSAVHRESDQGEGRSLHVVGQRELPHVLEHRHVDGHILVRRTHLGDPWVLEGLLGSGTLRGTAPEQESDEVFGVVTDALPAGTVEVKHTPADLGEDLVVVAAVERGRSAQQHVDDDADAPDVADLVVGTIHHLRTDVVDSAVHGRHGDARVEYPAESEVDELERGVR
mmetsp:Transcript_13035/g.31144  ORF Transcript_13035/g.31144 Transcript_13035/m.31144 type:complete len:241 (-) Transcript_13035:950-1672(-)